MSGARSSRAALLFFAAVSAPPVASAHGFGQRFDLPLPLWLWIAGAAATIVLTFAIVALYARDPHFGANPPRLDLWRFAVVRALAHPAVVASLRAVAVAVFVLALTAGFFGTQDPYRNLIVPVVWVAWWVGFAFVCALVGNLWALVDPLRTSFAWCERFAGRARASTRRLPYPERLGAWPAVALFFGFVWVELVWHDKDVPANLAAVVVAYAIIAWVGMLAFGSETWLRNGEAFSIAFGILARFAPLGYRASAGAGARLELRPWGAGLLTEKPVHVSLMVFVLLMLSSVTFDGFAQTPLMRRIETAALSAPALAGPLFRLSEWGFDETQTIHTAALVAFPIVFIAVFLFACRTMRAVVSRWDDERANAGSDTKTVDVARAFVLTLVPIAVAYHLSHYFSMLLTAGQFLIPLASDPFGHGWDLFGTARYEVNLGIVSPYVLWYGAVTLIVAGHVIAVVLAHVEALRIFGTRRRALASQIPMMLLMVAYTTLSLWILAQPIVG